jgi:predicted transcriptional regulator
MVGMAFKPVLRAVGKVNEEEEQQVIAKFLPDVYAICSNKTRAGILHLLIGSPQSMHTMSVEQLSYRLGIHPSVCIHHLERLEEWQLVEVKKSSNYGSRKRRSLWGLKLQYPNWILECYRSIRMHFFSEKELEEATSRNKSFRRLS